jgi:hypothetical protein
MQAAGLVLNPRDSCAYIPSWSNLNSASLKAQPGVSATADQKYTIDMGNGEHFPLELTGIKILGCPIGTQMYCETQIRSTIAKIETDLQLLKDFKWLHQRAKLAIYCCNTRMTYLLRATPVLYTQRLAKVVDETFDHFMADLLSFESGYAVSNNATHYANALQQCRLGIKQGGLGLTKAALVAPAANYVALRDFYSWYTTQAVKWGDEAFHCVTWLQTLPTSSESCSILFPYVAKRFGEVVDVLSSEWQIQGSLQDVRKQHTITQLMKDTSRKRFIQQLGANSAEAYRLEAVSVQSVPTRDFTSDIRPACSHDTDRLRHSPMGLMALMCPFELSNTAFTSTLAILLGVPVPYARYLRTQNGYHHIDEWGDSLLNDSSHAKWTASHNTIVRKIAQVATNYGVPSSGLTREVPVAEPGTVRRGDLSVLANHVLCRRDQLDPDLPIGSQSQLVLDFTLGHTFTNVQRGKPTQRLHVLKRGTLPTMESDKCSTYKSDYHTQGHAFAALVTNSFGQLGPEFLRFLWALADYAARNLVPVPLPILPVLGSPPAGDGDDDSPLVRKFRRVRRTLYLRARLEILLAVYEGISERIVGRTYALQNSKHFWFRIQDISAVWRPDLGGSGDSEVHASSGEESCGPEACSGHSSIRTGGGDSSSQFAVLGVPELSNEHGHFQASLQQGGYAAALIRGTSEAGGRGLVSTAQHASTSFSTTLQHDPSGSPLCVSGLGVGGGAF